MANRLIPSSMATQHPDNSGVPYWSKKAYISSADEIEECYKCFNDLGIDEYNWDWEGKFVDEAVTDRLLHKHLAYFRGNPIGSRKFLTFRIPNPRVEKQFRLARAFMVIVTSSQLAKSLGFLQPPIFETILPLTEKASEIIDIQDAFSSLVKLEHRLLKMDESIKDIEIIPLFEQVSTIIKSADIIREYIKMTKKSTGKYPAYLRPYCARSDPALNSGLIPTMLAVKKAVSDYHIVEKETGVKIFPMLGTGCLPFRGGLSPDRVEDSCREYAGFRTLTVQSAFRYDYGFKKVKEALKSMNDFLPSLKPMVIEDKLFRKLSPLIIMFEKAYRQKIEALSPLINLVSESVPRRRERVQHVGLFGYSRGSGKVTLPRAIPFTCSLYSLGVPPEIIGISNGLKEAKKEGNYENIKKIYLNFKDDIKFALKYCNIENISELERKVQGLSGLRADFQIAADEAGIDISGNSIKTSEHYKITSAVYNYLKNGKNISGLITRAGKIRKSLG